jgi:hypothetical protein
MGTRALEPGSRIENAFRADYEEYGFGGTKQRRT